MRKAGEKAMALVDGQLAPAEVPGLVQELARDPSLVAELQTYLALSRSRIASAFAAKDEEPVPAWLTETITRGGNSAERQPARQSGFGQSLLRWLQGSYRVPAWSLAAAPAAVVLLAVLAGGLAVPHPGRGEAMKNVTLAPPLWAALCVALAESVQAHRILAADGNPLARGRLALVEALLVDITAADHVDEVLPPDFGGKLRYRETIRCDGPAVGVEEPQEQIDQRTLARAAAPDEGRYAPGGQCQAHAVEHRMLAARIGEGDAGDLDCQPTV